MKKLHILLVLAMVLSYLPCGVLPMVAVEELSLSLGAEEVMQMVETIDNKMDLQWERERALLEEYRRGVYPVTSPLVVVDPYGWAPLTALLLFDTTEKAKVKVTVLGKEDGQETVHQFESNDFFHQIPVLGLYPDWKNQVVLTMTYEDGSQEEVLVEIPIYAKDTQDKTHLSDEFGVVRWFLDYPQTAHLIPMSNGHVLLQREDGMGFYEMDLLGKLYGDYSGSHFISDTIAELPSGNFLLCTDQLSSYQDRLIELDRDTGEIVGEFDLRTIFAPAEEANGLVGDWYQLFALEFSESAQSVILYSRNHGTAEISYPEGVLLKQTVSRYQAEPFGALYPDFWEVELLTNKGKVMAKNGQDVMQTTGEFIQSEGVVYDRVISGEVSLVRNENHQSLELIGSVADVPWQSAYLLFQGDSTYGLELERWVTGEEEIALSLSYDEICGSIPDGMYEMGLFFLTEEERIYLDFDLCYEVNQRWMTLEEEDLLLIQGEISDHIYEAFGQGDYTLDSPLIVVNPYGNSPLTALVLFRTEETGTTEMTLHGKEEDMVEKFSSITATHALPIYGLYANARNVVTIQFTTEKGQRSSATITIDTEALPSYVEDGVVLSTTDGSVAEGLTFVSGYGLTAYDHSGAVRWYSDLVQDSPILRLANGNLLIHSDKSYRKGSTVTGFYEIDLLGRVYHEYVVNGSHHAIQELSNGDFIIAAERNNPALYSVEEETLARDYLFLMDRETGLIEEEWDLQEVLRLEEYQADYAYVQTYFSAFSEFFQDDSTEAEWMEALSRYDWFHNNAFYFDEKRDSITISGKHKDMILEFDADSLEVLWMMGEEDLWRDMQLQGSVSAFYGQSDFIYANNGDLMVLDNGQHRDKIYSEELETNARVVGYRLDKEEKTVEEVFVFTYLPTAGTGDLHELGQSHYLFHFSQIEGEDVSHLVEWKEGEVVHLLEVSGETSFSQRMNLYAEQTFYHNFFYETSRLGMSNQTEYVTESLPLPSEDVDFTVVMAVDQGDRMGLQISFHNHPEAQRFLVLNGQEELRCYPITGDEAVYINKGGIPSGDYEIGVLVTDEAEKYYTSSGYYVSLLDTESFFPLVEESPTMPEDGYETAVVVATGLCVIGGLTSLQALISKQRKLKKANKR